MFDEVIQRLSRVTGTAPFPPHITLLGSVTAGSTFNDAVAQVADSTEPVPVQLTQVEHSDQVFRCVTLSAAPGHQLSEARSALLNACGGDDVVPYEPHLSVLYGALPANERQQLAHSVDLALPVSITVDALHVVDVSHDDWGRWAVVAQWPLKGGRAS
ncbi:MAG: hypothetical protein QOJ00_1361 [Actinomycetota bacterium]|jgi:2'-5' RNA ligase